MLDEAIRRNISELVASAFGSHASETGVGQINRPGMEVQDVTVYVNNGQNGEITIDDQEEIEGSGSLSNHFEKNNRFRNEGSISIQNVPFVPHLFDPSPSTNENKEQETQFSDGTLPSTPHITVSKIQRRIRLMFR